MHCLLASPTVAFKSYLGDQIPGTIHRGFPHPKGNLAGSISKLAAIASFHTLSNSLFTDNSIIPYNTAVRLKLGSAKGCRGGSERRKCVNDVSFFIAVLNLYVRITMRLAKFDTTNRSVTDDTQPINRYFNTEAS